MRRRQTWTARAGTNLARKTLLERERKRVIGQLSSGIAHDLNNMLNAMMLNATLAGSDPACTEKQAKRLDALKRIIMHAAETVGSLTRLAGGKPASALEPPLPVASHPERSIEPPRGCRILVIDDEPDNLEATQAVIEADGQIVDIAASGAEALDLLVRMGARYDLVLCDVGMPDMDGWEVAEAIHHIAPGTRVFMMTGWTHEIADHDPRLRHASGILPKPMDPEWVKALLAEHRRPSRTSNRPGAAIA
jgi:CheY-like chemotaxis protein